MAPPRAVCLYLGLLSSATLRPPWVVSGVASRCIPRCGGPNLGSGKERPVLHLDSIFCAPYPPQRT